MDQVFYVAFGTPPNATSSPGLMTSEVLSKRWWSIVITQIVHSDNTTFPGPLSEQEQCGERIFSSKTRATKEGKYNQ